MVMNTAYSSTYLMEDPREALRLELKVDPEAWVHKYAAHRIRRGSEVLSVGCGPGVLLRQIAELAPSIRGTGIDISPERVQIAVLICRPEINHPIHHRRRGNHRVIFAGGVAPLQLEAPNIVDVKHLFTRVPALHVVPVELAPRGVGRAR